MFDLEVEGKLASTPEMIAPRAVMIRGANPFMCTKSWRETGVQARDSNRNRSVNTPPAGLPQEGEPAIHVHT